MPAYLLPIILFIFGTLIGSFLNVLIWRLPREEKITGRSRCPHCSHMLGAAELVPILSYIRQGGKCASCRGRISPRYPVIELITGILFALSVLVLPIAAGADFVVLFRLIFVTAILVVVFTIDLEHYLILDVIVFPAAIVAVILNVVLDLALRHQLLTLSSHTLSGLVAAAAGSVFFYLIWRVSNGKWMGFGDVKFVLLLGLILGLPSLVIGLFLAFMIGAIVGVGLVLAGAKHLSSKIPFGTFLSIGALIALWYGPELWRWYLGILGW